MIYQGGEGKKGKESVEIENCEDGRGKEGERLRGKEGKIRRRRQIV